MKCKICKKMLRSDNKYQICSNCQGRSLGSLIRDGILNMNSLNAEGDNNTQQREFLQGRGEYCQKVICGELFTGRTFINKASLEVNPKSI